MNKQSAVQPYIEDEECLYRGVVPVNWDEENNRPSSAAFKDSKGVSVNRDAHRPQKECVQQLLQAKSFKAVCKVSAGSVRKLDAYVQYQPVPDNIYHSEIHDSEEKIELSRSKAKKVRDAAEVVFIDIA